MKTIELLQKIWKDELADKTKVIFKDHNTECIFHKNERRFEFVNKGDWNDYFNTFTLDELGNDVEIIEEKPKKIEHLEKRCECVRDGFFPTGFGREYYDKEDVANKINEIIDNLNYLIEKSDSK